MIINNRFAKFFILLTAVCMLLSCSSKKIAKVYWQGNLIERIEDVDYLYWRDGNQFFTQQNNQIVVSLTGFSVARTVYVLISITNNKINPVTFYKYNCKLSYKWGYRDIDLKPVPNKDLGKSHLSLFNSLIRSAGGVTRMFINIPFGEILKDSDKERLALENIGHEYNDGHDNMTRKIFINNHTIFPGTNYAGFLVFEFERQKFIRNHPFYVQILLDDLKFTATGQLTY